MFNFLNRRKKPDVTSTIMFDERFCHSAGPSGGETYEIKKGTTEIIFIFEKFDAFISTYLSSHPYLPLNIKRLIPEKKGFFRAQLVQDGLYLCTNSVSPDGHISFRPESLRPLNGYRRLRTFSRGAIAFGIFESGSRQFHVLWATMYRTGEGAIEA
jgi:hypothetical protein